MDSAYTVLYLLQRQTEYSYTVVKRQFCSIVKCFIYFLFIYFHLELLLEVDKVGLMMVTVVSIW